MCNIISADLGKRRIAQENGNFDDGKSEMWYPHAHLVEAEEPFGRHTLNILRPSVFKSKVTPSCYWGIHIQLNSVVAFLVRL